MRHHPFAILIISLILIQLPHVALAQVLIEWTPNGESDFAYYSVYRSTDLSADLTDPTVCVACVNDPQYFDNSESVETVYYWISAVDRFGNESPYSNPLTVYPTQTSSGTLGDCEMAATTSGEVNKTAVQPLHCFPSPFNSTTTIAFTLEAFNSSGVPVTLKIYNSAGKLVKTLVDSYLSPGLHTTVWDGKDQRGGAVSAGVYFCCLRHQEQWEIESIILIK
ncbi:MAG: FlgD immunoglobulin-like domain containing protein [bacterium]